MKRIPTLLLTFIMILSIVNFMGVCSASDDWLQSGDFQYAEEGDTITITGYTGMGGEVTIPSVIDGKPVTKLWQISFPNGNKITLMTIPNSITIIGVSAFWQCTSLTDIQVDSNNPNYSSISGVLFNKDKSEIIKCPNAKNGEYAIPDCVTSIGDYAFSDCKSITSIIIPNSVTSIGDYAFSNCKSIASIIIPNSVTNTGNSIFSNCGNLISITIPNSVTSIGKSAFWGCKSLASITIPNSVTSIGYEAFSNCTGLVSISIPSSVISIDDGAFFYCTNLATVNISTGVTSIGYAAFSCCKSLTSITIPESVESIGDYAFGDCNSLKTIIILSRVAQLKGNVFSGCTSLFDIQVDIGNPLYSSVNGVLFSKDMKKIIKYPNAKSGGFIIPDSVVDVGESAFSGCCGLTSVTIPNSVMSIEESAFHGCGSLTSVTIPNSVTGIGDYAFSDCTSLTSIIIPISVSYIGEVAFAIFVPTQEDYADFYNSDKSKIVLHVDKDSYAETYAQEQHYQYMIGNILFPNDITTLPWATEYIKDVITKNIMLGSRNANGSLSFNPAITATRAEFATVLFNYLGPTKDTTKTFSDTTNHWAKDYISTLVSQGIMTGYNDAMFAPDDPITREQIAAVLNRAFKPQSKTRDFKYKDDTSISDWARESVYAVHDAGWMNGDETGAFCPASTAIRAEIATIFSRLAKANVK